ncbi:Endonuclease 8-like 1 [Saguinus oedipus]|uniref:Endonuclease 8-like 1 n=1 Tax=Saguinus oedipus TaxID=9490 RepID=A0ABQ9V1Y1_SAGOE|nr:Endonuclease 8-like 1 [Saguinus oedipus]
MPEGPELHLASQFVNEACRALVFRGCVEKSSVSRNPEVPFESSAYHISASARGKELPDSQPPPRQEPLALVFRFGMSGSFQPVLRGELPRHAHLHFYTAPPGPQLAVFRGHPPVRPLGSWGQVAAGPWALRLAGIRTVQEGVTAPPGMMQVTSDGAVENVLRNLSDKAFDWPICEALLDQRFFNGIGNYLRVEILYRSASRHGHGDRLNIPPFEKVWSLLEALQQPRPSPELTLSQKIKAKLQNPDLLELCHSVPKEVVQLVGKGYGSESGEEDFAPFCTWLPCYGMPGMSSLQDRNGRTIWFQVGPCSHRQRDPMRLMGRNETWGHKNWGGDARGLSRPSKDHTVPEGHATPLPCVPGSQPVKVA